MRILLVEDDRALGEGIRTALKPEGYTVDWLQDGASALHALSHESFELAILDLGLPRMDGLEVLKTVRETAELRSIPVVMLTSSRGEPDLMKAYELGVNAYVVKPVEFKDFVAAISDLGIFWAVLNEPPPGSLRLKRARNKDEKN